MTYYTKVLGRTVSPAEAWAREPARRSYWFPAGAPPASGPDWSDGPDPTLARAVLAGKAAQRAGFGPQLRRDGRIPCHSCVPCMYEQWERCPRSLARPEARLRFAQAAADRIDQAEATMVELQRVVYREEHRRQLAF